MDHANPAPVTIDPSGYAELFEGHRAVPEAISGVCGRVVRGRADADFSMLAFASGRRLAWVTGPDGLRAMIGRSGSEIVLGIGKDRSWLREKLAEGMRWQLFVLPQAECTRADWAGIFTMLKTTYPEVARKLLPWREALRDPMLTLSIPPSLVSSAVKDDEDHPEHMSVARYETCADTAENARLFLWHTLGLNQHFKGDGWATDPLTGERVKEYLTANVPLSEIVGHRVIALDVEP